MNPYAKRPLTISEGTISRYRQLYQQLNKRFSREARIDEMTPDEVTATFIGNMQNFSMASFRLYKAAILYVLKNDVVWSESAIELLEETTSAGLRKKGSFGPSHKRKEVPTKAWRLLQDFMRDRITGERHQYTQALLDITTATLHTGLRPNEWATCEIIEQNDSGKKILRVQNSKTSNGRANGEFREIFIHQLDDTAIKAIQGAIRYFAGSTGEEAEARQKALADEMTKCIRACGTTKIKRDALKGISLYSFRHQFIANAKATFEDPTIIAALSGHSATRTAFVHYGKRRNATGKVQVAPTPESIDLVHNRRMETYKAYVESGIGKDYE